MALPVVSSFNAQDIIQKARELSAKLHSHNDIATDLLLASCSLRKREEALDEFLNLLDVHNSIAFLGVTRANVVEDLHQENRVIRALRQENDDLHQAVLENGDAIQYIMRKYHQHSKKLGDIKRKEAMCPRAIEKVYGAIIHEQSACLDQALMTAKDYIAIEDENVLHREQLVGAIKKENFALRKVLDISGKNLYGISAATATEAIIL